MESNRTSPEKGTGIQLIASSEDFLNDEFACGYKECNTCGVLQPYDNFRVEAKGVGGRKAACKACTSIYERTIKSPPKKGKISNDRIQKALEAAAYRIIKESM